MPLYTVVYHAKNEYELKVHQALFRLLTLPANISGVQKRIEYNLEVSTDYHHWDSYNPFGSESLIIRPEYAFSTIEITVRSDVWVQESDPFAVALTDPAEELLKKKEINYQINHYFYLWQTVLTAVELAQFPNLPLQAPEEVVFSYLIRLREYLHAALAFESGVTDAHTPAMLAWEQRNGVCQDFAHIFIGLCRAMGIPARYVGGYLSQGSDFRGSSQLHAWVECHLPLHGWIGIDPSNNLQADHHYIKICHGRDFYDCSPITGVLISGGKQVSLQHVYVHLKDNDQ